jgi:hypothetical protein
MATGRSCRLTARGPWFESRCVHQKTRLNQTFYKATDNEPHATVAVLQRSLNVRWFGEGVVRCPPT